MTDEQRDQLAMMVDSINRDVDKNKVEVVYEESKRRLEAFIQQQRIDPEDLPHYKIREVVRDCDCMTILTDNGRYVHVCAEPSYGDNVVFSVGSCPDIEDSHSMGILSQEQYDEYKVAQRAHLNRRRTADVANRLKTLVREAGAETVRDYLDELNQ